MVPLEGHKKPHLHPLHPLFQESLSRRVVKADVSACRFELEGQLGPLLLHPVRFVLGPSRTIADSKVCKPAKWCSEK